MSRGDLSIDKNHGTSGHARTPPKLPETLRKHGRKIRLRSLKNLRKSLRISVRILGKDVKIHKLAFAAHKRRVRLNLPGVKLRRKRGTISLIILLLLLKRIELMFTRQSWKRNRLITTKTKHATHIRKRLQRTRLSAHHFSTLSSRLSCLRNWSYLFCQCFVLRLTIVSVVSVLCMWCDLVWKSNLPSTTKHAHKSSKENWNHYHSRTPESSQLKQPLLRMGEP